MARERLLLLLHSNARARITHIHVMRGNVLRWQKANGGAQRRTWKEHYESYGQTAGPPDEGPFIIPQETHKHATRSSARLNKDW